MSDLDKDKLTKQVERAKWMRRLRYFGIYGFLTLITLPIFLGYIWLIIGSFSESLVGFIPQGGFSLKNWTFLWSRPQPHYPSIWPCLLNTLQLAVGVAVIATGTSVLAGYIISRMKFRGRSLFMASTLILHAFPAISLLIALYYLLKALGLLNSLLGPMLVRAGFMVPFSIWIMKGFFDGVSWDMERAALVDGASRFQAWYKVVLPQVKPGIAAISLFTFLYGWAEYIFVITFIRDTSAWTLTSYINSIISNYRFTEYGLLASTSLLYITPVIIFFIFTQKYLLKMTIGGSKGGV